MIREVMELGEVAAVGFKNMAGIRASEEPILRKTLMTRAGKEPPHLSKSKEAAAHTARDSHLTKSKTGTEALKATKIVERRRDLAITGIKIPTLTVRHMIMMTKGSTISISRSIMSQQSKKAAKTLNRLKMMAAVRSSSKIFHLQSEKKT